MDSFAQAAGLNALSLTDMIISAAKNARTHRRNCEKLAEHVRIIANLLGKLKSSDLMNLPATREPLDGLEEALRKALDLVESCKDRSYLYMLALGWGIVYQFRRVQAEIDGYLRLVPLISAVHEFRMQEGLESIEKDQREYFLEEEEMEAQNVILKTDRSKKDADVLEKSLSRRYPDLKFHEALLEEKQKLNIELHRSRTNNNHEQCRVIKHLIDVTESVINELPDRKVGKLVNEPALVISGYVTNNTNASGYGDLGPKVEDKDQSEWQADLFGCCSEPCLSLKTSVYPCGTFSSIANLVSKGKLSRERAINNLMAYSLFCACCCYSCFMRRRLRRHFNIEGGLFDDFITHLMCCCCAMVQERRELGLRGFEGCQGRMIPPQYQDMKP